MFLSCTPTLAHHNVTPSGGADVLGGRLKDSCIAVGHARTSEVDCGMKFDGRSALVRDNEDPLSGLLFVSLFDCS